MESLNKNFVPYELALKLKELGFDEPINASWFSNKIYTEHTLGFSDKWINHNAYEGYLSAPLWQQAFEWFREKHDLGHYIKKNYDFKKYFFTITRDGIIIGGTDVYNIGDTYEEAQEACLTKLIEIVQDENKLS